MLRANYCLTALKSNRSAQTTKRQPAMPYYTFNSYSLSISLGYKLERYGKKVFSSVFGLLMLVLLPSMQAGHAQTPGESGKRIALLIGNSAYTDDSWDRLPNAAKDAQDVGNELKRLGFLPEDVEVLQNINKYTMQTALTSFSKRAEKAAQVVLYFSGHGVEAAKENFLIPVDARALNENNLHAIGVPLDELLAKISVGNGLKLVMIDACRIRPKVGGRQSNTGGLEPPGFSAPETLVVFAAAAGKFAYDGKGYANGFFAQGLLAGLRADDPSFLGVMKVTASKVAELAEKEGKTQEVTKYGGVRAESAFAFAPVKPAQAIVAIPVAPATPAPNSPRQLQKIDSSRNLPKADWDGRRESEFAPPRKF